MSKDKKKKSREVTRRQFIAGTGIVVGGAAIGSAALLAACGGGDGATATETVTQTQTQTQTATQTVTTTAGEVTQTVTTTAPGTTQTVTVEVPVLEELPTLTVNGGTHKIDLKPDWTLAFVLRDKLGLFATKIGCDMGACGACTVIADGKAVFSCLILAVEAAGKDIWTVEGLSDGIALAPVQQAFLDNDAFQCGYCTPGFLMAGKALLDEKPNPTMDEVREALSGHICPCGIFYKVLTTLEGGV